MAQKKPKSEVKIASKTINRPDVIGTEFSVDDSYDREEKKADQHKMSMAQKRLKYKAGLNSLAERLADDKLCHKNYSWPGAKQAFPMNPEMHYVDLYYPYAQGGPLFIDEPKHRDDIKVLEMKQEAMLKLGHRYIIIKPSMTELEAFEALSFVQVQPEAHA